MTMVNFEESGFTMNGKSIATTEGLVSELQGIPNLEGIGFHANANVPKQRVKETLAAIKRAGIDVPTAVIGSEQFISQ